MFFVLECLFVWVLVLVLEACPGLSGISLRAPLRGFSDISWISPGGVVSGMLKLGFTVGNTPYYCIRVVHR